MNKTQAFAPGNYHYLSSGVLAFSNAVVADANYTIERVVFSRVLPLAEGFAKIEQYIQANDRPVTALCGLELRSPGPFDDAGFAAFNDIYSGTLREWGIIEGDINPTVRSNVAPLINPPKEPGLYGFSYTRPDSNAQPTFLSPGISEESDKGETPDQYLIAYQDTSPEGIRKKALWVLDEMQQRLEQLGFSFKEVTGSQVYTVHPIHHFLTEQFAKRRLMDYGLAWHLARPPVVDNEFELDCRRVFSEKWLNVG